MSLDVSAVRTQIATQLTAGILANDFQVKPTMLSAPSDKAIDIFPDSMQYDGAMGRGIDRWTFIVRAMRAFSGDIEAQATLDELMAPAGTMSIKALIEADRTLGGLVSDAHVASCSGYRIYLPHSQTPFMGVEWTVEVLASGK